MLTRTLVLLSVVGILSCSNRDLPTSAPVTGGPGLSANLVGGGPAIWTEKADYIPRESVGTYGSGWQPGESVLLTYAEDPQVHPAQSFTTTADTLGNIEFGEFAPDDHHLGVSFILTAVGQTSGLQTYTTFTDAIVPGPTQFNNNTTGNPGSSRITISTPSFPGPVPPAPGDVLVAQIVVSADFGTAVICTPAGWTSILRNDRDGKVVQQTFHHVVGAAAEPTTYTWDFRTNAASCGTATNLRLSTGASGGIVVYTGVDPTTPLDVAPLGSSGSSSGPFRAPEITTGTNGAQILRFFAAFKSITITPTTGRLWTTGSTNNSAERTAGAFHAAQASAGPTGTFDATFSSSAEWASQTVALRMAATGPTKLAFTTSAFTGVANQCLGVITVQTQNATNAATNVLANTTVNLATDGSGAFYGSADATCSGVPITSLVISTGGNTASFRYKALARGDGTHLLTASATGLTSATQTQTINLADQTINFPAVGPFSFGDSPFTVAATATSGLAVTCATQTLAVCTVSGSTVTILAAGTCTIRASQGVNGDYNAAPNVDQNITINLADQTINFPAVGPFTFSDASFAVAATATSGLGVTFTSQTTGVCTVSGTTVTIVTVGTCTIRASQAGNSNYNPAPNVDQDIAINLAGQTINFPAVGPFTFGDTPFTVTATATSGLTVTFTSLTLPVCTVSGSTVTILAAGTCTIRASQAGNAEYSPAPNVDQNITINQADQTINFPAVGPYTFGNPAFTVAATATSGLAVSFATQTPLVCTVSGSSVTILAAGTCTVRASQGGNGNYNPAPNVDRNITINQANQTINFPSVGPYAFGSPPFTVAATATSGLTVNFASQTPLVCTVSGATVTIVAPGTCITRASQAGNGNYNPAPNVDQNITLSNQAPVVTSVTGPIVPTPIGSAITVNAAFTDPGYPGDIYTSSVVWQSVAGTYTSTPTPSYNGSTGGTLSATRSDLPAGVYQVTVTVTDQFGLSGSLAYNGYLVVYDPSSGFVTGGGWINSPAGAYPADPDLVGKASFWLVSKYKKGANLPDGNTEFQFQAAGLKFHSTSYEWLVVAGTRAQFKGLGALNGVDGYGFLLTAVDGSPDLFRIKIWNSAGTTIYDNQIGASDTVNPTTTLGGGSIVIHK